MGYDESQTDLTSVLVAAHATTADMVIPYSDSTGCVNLAKSLIQLGITDAKKIVSAPLCLNGQVAAGLGGDFPIWTYAIASSLYGDPTDPGMPPYITVTAKFEPRPTRRTRGTSSRSPRSYHRPVHERDRVREPDPGGDPGQAKAFKGPLALGAPSLDCGMFSVGPRGLQRPHPVLPLQRQEHWAKEAGWLQPPS